MFACAEHWKHTYTVLTRMHLRRLEMIAKNILIIELEEKHFYRLKIRKYFYVICKSVWIENILILKLKNIL